MPVEVSKGVLTKEEIDMLLAHMFWEKVRSYCRRIFYFNYSYFFYTVLCNMFCICYWSHLYLLYTPALYPFLDPYLSYDTIELELFFETIVDDWCSSVYEYNSSLLSYDVDALCDVVILDDGDSWGGGFDYE